MKTKVRDAVSSQSMHHEPGKRVRARRAKAVAHPKHIYYKGRRVLTEDDRKQMACPYPPEPEWVAVLESAAQRREKGGGL